MKMKQYYEIHISEVCIQYNTNKQTYTECFINIEIGVNSKHLPNHSAQDYGLLQ